MVSKEDFLQQVNQYLLDISIDEKHLLIYGCGTSFNSYIFRVYDRQMIYLSELYSDIPTLFVIFAINSIEGPLKDDTYPVIEWRVINTGTGEEITSHFSYQLPGDDTYFSTTRKEEKNFLYKNAFLNVLPRNGYRSEPIIFIAEDKRSLRASVLNIPNRYKNNLGVLAVQESEAIADLENLILPTASNASIQFLLDIPVKFIDRRKHSDSNTIGEEKFIYCRQNDIFTIPVLCKSVKD